MELDGYLKLFLYHNDQIVIPGIGGLLTKYRPADIDAVSGVISPPTKILTFDPELTDNDHQLEKFISQQRKISQKDAGKFVASEVSTFLQKLESGETVLLEDIGYFSRAGLIIRFENVQHINFNTASFGLPKVDYKTVELTLTPQIIPEVSQIYPKRSKIWVYVLMIIVIAAVGICGYVFYPQMKIYIARFSDKHVPAVVPPVAKVQPKENGMTESKFKEDSIMKDTLEKVVDEITSKKNALAIKPQEKKAVESGTYYIIAGSFKTQKGSEKLVNELQAQGTKCEIIECGQDLFRISIGTFHNKADALTELEKIKLTKGKDAVWLFSK